jgi:hypothetical protein
MPIPIGCVDKKYKEIMQPQSALLCLRKREKREREREREREKKIGHMNMG